VYLQLMLWRISSVVRMTSSNALANRVCSLDHLTRKAKGHA
jgi:hypothetical protein